MDPSTRARRDVGLWAGTWVGAVGSQIALGTLVERTWVAPVALFWIVVVAASGCAVFALAVVIRGVREGVAESALLGAFLTAVSILPLAHGLLVPGVLVGPNDGVVLSAQLAVPVGGLALVPLLRPHRPLRRWRAFVVAHVVATAALASLLVAAPDLLPAAATGTVPAAAVAGISLAIGLAVSRRHLRLALLSRHWHPLAVSIGLVLVTTAPLVFVAGDVFGAGFWWAHGLDITGVFLAAITATFAFRRGATTTAVLAPIDGVTPLLSLELGLDPLVHRFVADLDRKDPVTRDHVVRTARLAVHVAGELGLPPTEVGRVAIAAILHDVGKLEIPDAILHKPDRLTDDEFAVIRTHAALGADLLAASPALADAAPLVRGHHERVDGRGYPDGLAGEAIPTGARVVAACDAWDAMAHTRQYRAGMDLDRVHAVLREHAGSQWDPTVVEALLRVVEREPGLDGAPELADVGRAPLADCCHDSVPAGPIA